MFVLCKSAPKISSVSHTQKTSLFPQRGGASDIQRDTGGCPNNLAFEIIFFNGRQLFSDAINQIQILECEPPYFQFLKLIGHSLFPLARNRLFLLDRHPPHLFDNRRSAVCGQPSAVCILSQQYAISSSQFCRPPFGIYSSCQARIQNKMTSEKLDDIVRCLNTAHHLPIRFRGLRR